MPQDAIRILGRNEVEDVLKKASQFFFKKDKYLLRVEANERSLTHKFAEYIQEILNKEWGDSWDVDCEYNRYRNNPKIIKPIKEYVGDKTDTAETNSRTVYPDIIVHKRGSSGSNLIVIEAKKKPGNDREFNSDKKKLILIKKKYGYNHAAFLLFDTINKTISWEFII